jgi:hypothetical protein
MKMKTCFVLVIFALVAANMFPGGQAASGRDSSLDTIEAGQFVDPARVDAYLYQRLCFPLRNQQQRGSVNICQT